MEEFAPHLAAALALLVYIELRVVRAVERAVAELELAREIRRRSTDEREGQRGGA